MRLQNVLNDSNFAGYPELAANSLMYQFSYDDNSEFRTDEICRWYRGGGRRAVRLTLSRR
jgi:hypothetical protein